jgi:malonate-semialdehyde dehydrogenase (acetylating)/methylmalonate-semialdehyde dehydrogenase
MILEEPIKGVEKLKNYINGEWVESRSEQILDIANPATSNVLGRVPLSTDDEVKEAVEAAQEAFEDWRDNPSRY